MSNPSSDRPTIAQIAEQYRAIHADLEGESDRAAAVLGAAYLDELLEQLLVHACVTPTAGSAQRNFYSRIEATYAMGLIPEMIRDDLHILRELRNRFAHKSEYRTLSQASAKELLMRLHLKRAVDEVDLTGYPDIDRRLHRQAISSLRLELAYRIREAAPPTPPLAVSPAYVLVQEGRKAPPLFGVVQEPY